MDRLEVKEKEMTTLKVKYARSKTLLKSQGVIASGISHNTSGMTTSGSSHRVRTRMGDTASNGSSVTL